MWYVVGEGSLVGKLDVHSQNSPGSKECTQIGCPFFFLWAAKSITGASMSEPTLVMQWRSKGQAWPGTCPAKAPCLSLSCHMQSLRKVHTSTMLMGWRTAGARPIPMTHCCDGNSEIVYMLICMVNLYSCPNLNPFCIKHTLNLLCRYGTHL